MFAPCWRVGFPVCCFPPCGVSPRGVRGLCPLRSSDPRVALLSWVLLSSLRALARQTRAGSSLAAAATPQLRASAPLQQRRRLAHRPAHNTPRPPHPQKRHAHALVHLPRSKRHVVHNAHARALAKLCVGFCSFPVSVMFAPRPPHSQKRHAPPLVHLPLQ